LKRTPMVDVANMICSIHYTAYEGFLGSYQIQKEESEALLPFAEHWAHYMSGFFMKAYLEKVRNTALIPQDNEDLSVLLQTFLLERALHYFNAEIKSRSACVIAPLRMIQSVLKQVRLQPDSQISNTAIH
jgi:maltose alpha-D-glucosyltransferase / alpha-amylase